MKGVEPEKPRVMEPDPTVELVGFGPSLRQEGASLPSVADAAALARHHRQRWILILSAIALVIVLVFAGPVLYRTAKGWRASSLARSAEEQLAAHQIDEAVATVRSAYMMAPNDVEVLRAMAKILSTLNAPTAMTYWNWVLAAPSATVRDRQEATESALRLGLDNQAGTLIQGLLKEDPASAPNLLLAARYYAAAGATSQAMTFATKATAADAGYQPAIIFLANQELNNAYLRQAGVDALLKVARRNDAFAFLAIQRLADVPGLKPDEAAQALQHLNALPFTNQATKITQLILQLRQNPDQRDALLSQAVAADANASTDDLRQFGQWLNSIGEPGRVLTLIPKDRALSNKDLFLTYLDALGTLRQWKDMQALLAVPNVPLEAPYVELYLYRCARETGNMEDATLHWRSAELSASHNSRESLYIAGYAESLGDRDRAEPVYRLLTKDLMAGRPAYLGLLRIDAAKDTRTLSSLLDEMAARWPNDEAIANDAIYYHLLLNENIPQMYNRAVALAKADIHSAPHLTDVALAYLRLHKPALALRVFDEGHIQWSTASPSTLTVYAAALQANGRDDKAARVASTIPRPALRPEERTLIQSIP